MIRHVVSLAAALAVAAWTLLTGVGGLALPSVLAAGYNGPCTGSVPPPDQNNYHWFVYRMGGLSYSKAQGQTTIGTYLACTSGIAGWGQSMTVLATIQGSTTGGSNLAQCGVGQITGEGTHYWYTPYNDGVWAQFPTQPRLQLGDSVRCAVYSTSSGNWSYALTNITTNQTVYGSSSRSGYGTEAWWGHEISNDYDMFGGESGVDANYLMYPAYMYVGNGSLWYATADTGTPCCGTLRSWMSESVSHIGISQYDSINATGSPHN